MLLLYFKDFIFEKVCKLKKQYLLIVVLKDPYKNADIA